MRSPVMASEIPEAQVRDRPVRRRFSAEYKRSILRQADACKAVGEVGALLRREGLYSSHLSSWRSARDRGELEALAPKPRGPRKAVVDPRDKQISMLAREYERLNARLERAEALIELQKKVSHLLEIALPEDARKSS
jgi:transposase-like protein